MNKKGDIQRTIRIAKKAWPDLSREACAALAEIAEQHEFSISRGDILFLNNHWYITHTGLLGLARRNRCVGMDVQPVSAFCDPTIQRWAFKATVYKTKTCRGFVGYGDADPSNVSPVVHGAEMRIAETRAVNRALRKAYGIGICSVEELGATAAPFEKPGEFRKLPQPADGNGNCGGPKLRDRLCQLIRQQQLDPGSVKSYAADFCGVQSLKEASREQIENFIEHLADWAKKDRNALLCQLSSYQRTVEGVA